MGKSTNEMTAEQVSNALLAQLLPEVSVGGNWKWYGNESQEYMQITAILNKNADVRKYGVQYTLLNDGLLLYANVDKILSVVDNTAYSQTVDKTQMRENCVQVKNAEFTDFRGFLKNNLHWTGDRFMFGMYLCGSSNKYGVVENSEYRLFKLDAERVFLGLYYRWIEFGRKTAIYLVNFDGTRKCLDSAFKRYIELHKNDDAKSKASIAALSRNTLFGCLKPLYSGNALMCCVEI